MMSQTDDNSLKSGPELSIRQWVSVGRRRFIMRRFWDGRDINKFEILISKSLPDKPSAKL